MATRRQFIKATTIAGVSMVSTIQNTTLIAQSETRNATLKFATTSTLDIAYEEHGETDGLPVVLLHGFPYDIRSFDGVVPLLVNRGYRVILPYLRGYGPTRFRGDDLPRTGEQAALAQDLIDFSDALGITEFAVCGFDWGNRAACIASITDPHRIKALVAIGGYSVQNTITRGSPGPAAREAQLWYQWYFNTEQGRTGLEANRHDIIRYLWDTWSPGWTYSDADYQRSAPSFDNPDFVAVTIHSYRHRHVNAPGDARFLTLEKALAERPPITVPTIVLHAADSGFGRPSTNPAGDQARFINLTDRRIIEGAGHDLPAHRPDAVADALIALL